MVGKTIGHYRVVEQIGSGGMGAVYRAEDRKLGRDVALKFLPDDLAGSPERLERFQREARSVAALNHPNIVTVFSVEELEGARFITMELVRGKTLTAEIPKGGMPLPRFYTIAVSLSEALAAAHDAGITHRDLKPANIMIDDAGRVKIIDFGIAKAVSAAGDTDLSQDPTKPLTVEGRMIGTPAYMSPEQVEGSARVDHRTDIFSLGIVLYEMLTGSRPFHGESNISLMSAILRDSPELVSDLRADIPIELSRIIRRCLQKSPGERFQSALDVRNELKEQATELSESAIGVSTSTRARSDASVRTERFRIGIIAGTVLLAATLYLVLSPSTTDDQEAPPDSVSDDSSFAGIPRLTRLTTEPRLEAMPTWSPDGRQIAFMAIDDNGFKQIFTRDLDSNTVTRLTTNDYDHITPVWGPDMDTLYYTRSTKKGAALGISDSLTGFYIPGNIVRHRLDGGEPEVIVSEAGYPSVAPGGTNLFFTHRYRIWKSDLRGNRQEQLSTDEFDSMDHIGGRVSADGSKVVFRRINLRDRQYHLGIVTKDHHTSIVLTNGFNLHPTWHPSGHQIYYSTYRGGGLNIWRLPVTSTHAAAGIPRPVTVGAGYDLEAAFAPDGRRLAFTVSSLNADIYRIAIDPETGRTNGPPAEPMPFNTVREDSRAVYAPSTNETIIAFNSDRGGDMNLYIYREADGSVQQVTRGPGGDYQANWSPDLKTLAFFSSREGSADIFLVNTNGLEEPVRLTTHPGLDFNPFFSPDGDKIVFASDRDGGTELHIMDSDGANQRLLIRNASISHFHPWMDSNTLLNQVDYEGVRGYYLVPIDGSPPTRAETIDSGLRVGGHNSFSPDRSRILDLDQAHMNIWMFSLKENDGTAIYRHPDPGASLDYPYWSPDGKWAVFDLTRTKNSELFMAEWDQTAEPGPD